MVASRQRFHIAHADRVNLQAFERRPSPSRRRRHRGQPRRRRRPFPGAGLARAPAGRGAVRARRGQRVRPRRARADRRGTRRPRAWSRSRATSGFAGAANEGIARTRAPFVLLLNNDAVVEPDYVARLAARLEFDGRLAAVQGLVLTEDGRQIDTAGLEWNDRGEAVPVLSGADASAAPREPFEVSGVSATATLYRREALEAAGPARRRVRERVLRLLRGRGPVAAPAARGLAVRVRSARRAPGTRARAPGAARRFAARSGRCATAGGRSSATSRRRSSRRAARPSCARTSRTCAPSAGRARCCRCSSGRGCPSRRCARGTSRDGSRNGPAARERPRDHGHPGLLERRGGSRRRGRVARRPRGRASRRAGSPCRWSSWTTAAVFPKQAVRAAWPGATVLVNAANRGFGPAANQAAAAARGDVLLFLNPDTRAEGEPFSPIARAFDADERVVAVAPRLVEMDGGVPPAGRCAWLRPAARTRRRFSCAACRRSDPTPASCC